MIMNKLIASTLLLFSFSALALANQTEKTAIWHKYEVRFTSDKEYTNPVYDIKAFTVVFTSLTGREKTVNGFWDGELDWKVRFMPDELGDWTWISSCSDEQNIGLHQKSGHFTCVKGVEEFEIFRHGAIKHPPGKYYLTYDDGTPFFWMGCTAWNGAMKSTEADWDYYLKHRRDHHYNLIQFVTTQWRGGDSNLDGDLAYTGSGRIEINPLFFQKLDERVVRINEFGLVAAPVLLWALPFGDGRHLSPGYHLPVDEAVLLANISSPATRETRWSGSWEGTGAILMNLKIAGRPSVSGCSMRPTMPWPHYIPMASLMLGISTPVNPGTELWATSHRMVTINALWILSTGQTLPTTGIR